MNQIFRFQSGENILSISVCTEKIVHVTYGKDPDAVLNTMIVAADWNALPSTAVVIDETDDTYILTTDSLKTIIDKHTLDIRFERSVGSLLSSLYGHWLEMYSVHKTIGGEIETKQTVDGMRSNLEGGEQVFLRTSNHAEVILRFKEDEELD